MCEELWEQMNQKNSIFLSAWPVFDEKYCKDPEVTIAIQINGKLRDKVEVPADIEEEELKKIVLAQR